MAIPSSWVLKKVGYKKGMSIGLFIMAVGAILFVPAANTREFNLFLIALFIIGTGLALLQTASNPYVSIIGPIESAASRISIMGISNKIGGILAGIIFGFITLKDASGFDERLSAMSTLQKTETLNELASRVVGPYIIISIVLLILAIAILFSGLPDLGDEGEEETGAVKSTNTRNSVFQYPYLLLGVIALFLYVGVEVMAGDTIISYGKSLGIELDKARFFNIFTLGSMLAGYIIGIFTIPRILSQSMALRICAILGVIFTILAVVTNGMTSVIFIGALGLANSLMWPAIFPLAIEKLGRFIKIGSAFMIMAIAGGAILPLIYAKLGERIGTREAYIIMVPCYLYILFYAVKGHKIGKA
jgi:MFS transporter, FHS family, L-fucose permease